MDKLERLLNLAAALLHTPRPLTAVELTDRIGGYPESKAAFQRAFERDKDDLRSMGVPIRVEPVPGVDPPIDGYRIDRREYAGKELRFEPDELAALHLATNLVRLQGGPGDGLVKLGAATHEVPTPGMGRLPFDEGLELLMAAAAEHRIVTFGYNHVDREVEPWRVSFKRGHWYLTAWDRGRAGERIFRIDRIAHPIVPTGRAEAPVRVTGSLGSMRGWELGDAEPIEARLRVDADQAAWARHAAGTTGETMADGSVVLTLQVRNPDAFRSFALSFLEHGEVLDPPELRDDIVAWLRALA